MNYIYRKEIGNQSIIYIKGRLDYNDKMLKLIPEFNTKLNGTNMFMNEKEIVLDLSEVEFISEECLNLFYRLKTVYYIKLKFRNYSLFIEMQLEEHKLLDKKDTGSE